MLKVWKLITICFCSNLDVLSFGWVHRPLCTGWRWQKATHEVAVIPDPWLVGGSLCKWPPTGGDASWVTRGKQPEASWKTFGIKMLKSSSKLLLCFMVKYNWHLPRFFDHREPQRNLMTCIWFVFISTMKINTHAESTETRFLWYLKVSVWGRCSAIFKAFKVNLGNGVVQLRSFRVCESWLLSKSVNPRLWEWVGSFIVWLLRLCTL